MNTITLYGIPNCDSVKKARAQLTAQGLAYDFVDVKKTPLPLAVLEAALAALGWERVLNRAGTTWRQSSSKEQAQVRDAASAARYIEAKPSAMKRPLIDWGERRAPRFSVGLLW